MALPGRDLAGTTGLEPAASCVTGKRSNQLNYVPVKIAAAGKRPVIKLQSNVGTQNEQIRILHFRRK